MVCVRYVIVNTLHEGDKYNNNNNNNSKIIQFIKDKGLRVQ